MQTATYHINHRIYEYTRVIYSRLKLDAFIPVLANFDKNKFEPLQKYKRPFILPAFRSIAFPGQSVLWGHTALLQNEINGQWTLAIYSFSRTFSDWLVSAFI